MDSYCLFEILLSLTLSIISLIIKQLLYEEDAY